MHDCLDRLIVLTYFLSQLQVLMKSVIFTDSLDLVKLVQADHPKPTARHMLIELRAMHGKLKLSEKEVKRLVVPLRLLHDMLHYIPSHCVQLEHVKGEVNPADPLSKPVDLHVLVNQYMSNVSK
jgi:hypothetical protein